MAHRYKRKDEDLLESSWRAFWSAHDKVLIRSQLGFHEIWESTGINKTWELAGSLLGVGW